MIIFQNISKTYSNGTRALKNIDLDIEPGTFTFLTGTSGSGKSTLLKLIYREEIPSKGELIVFGKNIKNVTRSEVPRLRQQTGVIFQDFKLLPQKTAWENVAFALDILGVSKKEQAKRIARVLEVTGLKHLKDAYPGEMSGGEQQRISVARALVNKPPLLLADEPTGNLDPETSWEIMKLLMKIQQAGTTVIVCTHDSVIVEKAKQRVVVLKQGQIIQDTPFGGYHHG